MNLAFLSLLLVLTAQQLVANNYFQNLPISSSLMAQANSAVNDLRTYLDINFNCPTDDYYPGSKSPGPSASTTSFQWGLQNSLQSSFGNCLSKTLSGFPSLTLQYFSPAPSNYMSLSVIPYTQKFTLYNQLRNIISLLSQIKAVIKQYGMNNVVVGSGNTVSGQGNVVIGSNDNVKGTSNWILTSNYSSPDAQDGVLVLGNYMLELKQYYEVLQNPSYVVSCVNTQQAAQLVNVFWSNTSPTRRYCFNI